MLAKLHPALASAQSQTLRQLKSPTLRNVSQLRVRQSALFSQLFVHIDSVLGYIVLSPTRGSVICA